MTLGRSLADHQRYVSKGLKILTMLLAPPSLPHKATKTFHVGEPASQNGVQTQLSQSPAGLRSTVGRRQAALRALAIGGQISLGAEARWLKQAGRLMDMPRQARHQADQKQINNENNFSMNYFHVLQDLALASLSTNHPPTRGGRAISSGPPP